ncbi:hypothetical protein [Gordonia amicalis]|uniref:Cytochrome P450 n=1 Tax=Gordonia amicalis TaxID=89053 RepID=A0AAE4R7C3_9ACTN|nr:hypothetical protein [Gordonia amicalis]MBA5848970.1 hypothetical protein [Gordonia amicalis]MDV6312191.1 hypothetical protein [Gordonia amicalis]MDV7099505.1 hypothetical protein [Gordonia amicalis]NKX77836.1 hypothetical protein [Gordonia amicalis]UOG20789.1 cytochrome P450 [Gordonia amicalis]
MANVTSDWDPLSEANLADPFAVQKEMRGKCPVAWTEQFGGAWAVFKHADIEQVAGDPETFSAAEVFVVPDRTGGVFPWLPVQSDPPQHADYRALVAPFFRMEKTKAEPGGDDLMSALMEADIDGRPLTNEEIFGTFILLIVGGSRPPPTSRAPRWRIWPRITSYESSCAPTPN